ncbi:MULTISPECIES: acyl carrier protein [Nonomuraea]|uniref:Acyl carrier protein n=2 Tax=Nonomuraea TaxID=83681 RepID=A0ABW1C8W9_9ACTN|nr:MULTISPECIES: phosphopantetheine-binding protein [Nonomuraea]MDA0646415.1 phosphopantetheine-binding protein [Nonomuraea ferruginea]TXK39208.1 acyl carrier protein [Nonomuraea sp. C10]
MTIDELRAKAAERQQTCDQIKKMIVSRLDLEIEPGWITDDQPLFGRGLELDSLDVLELYVAIEAEFGVALYDSEMAVFGSVSRLADEINPALRARG